MTELEKTEWVEALRDPTRYAQLTGSLVARGFKPIPGIPIPACCIGVAADVSTGVVKIGYTKGFSELDNIYTMSGLDVSQRAFFINLNDRYELTFDQIALVIENVPEAEWQ